MKYINVKEFFTDSIGQKIAPLSDPIISDMSK